MEVLPPTFLPRARGRQRPGLRPLSCPEVPLRPQDPSWNHRVYRLAVAKLSPPIIPFVPLLLKGGYLGVGAVGLLPGVGTGRSGVVGTPLDASSPPQGSDPQILPPADMTFIHEGNRTLAENLINFEKMVSGAGWLPVDPHLGGPACPPIPPGCRSRASLWR